MKFNYQARTKTGTIQVGQVEASNREAALNVLESHNLYVIVLEKASTPFYAKELAFLQRASKKDIVLFSRQLSIMFKSDVPVVESLKAIARQTRKEDFKKKVLKISEKVEAGMPLSEAFSIFPKLFSPFYISMVKSGEAAGKLTDVFNYLADYLEKERYFKGKIRGAMIYPAFVLAVFLIVVLIIIVYVIPQLSSALKASGAELPPITKLVINTSDFLRKNLLLVTIASFILIGAIIGWVRSKMGKKILGHFFLRVPVINTFLKKLYLSRIASNLSTLIAGGLPIAQALEMTGDIIGNEDYKKIILKARDGVKRGESISSILSVYPNLVSPLFFQMVSIGEKTGRLDSSLKNIVGYYQRDVDQSLDSFISLLEPVFIILLGGVVGGLMAAVLMPLYSGGAF